MSDYKLGTMMLSVARDATSLRPAHWRGDQVRVRRYPSGLLQISKLDGSECMDVADRYVRIHEDKPIEDGREQAKSDARCALRKLDLLERLERVAKKIETDRAGGRGVAEDAIILVTRLQKELNL